MDRHTDTLDELIDPPAAHSTREKNMQEQILAALKKLGPSSPGHLAEHLGATSAVLKPHFRALLDAGAIKAAGVTKSRRLALPDQDLDGLRDAGRAPPQPRKAKKPKSRKPRHAKRALHPHGRRALAPVIVNGAEPHIFNEEQTAAIASLLFQHYDKA
jgi:DNA-binding transcriptional ArsR family regulator